jgi:hypothetical protein
MERVFNLIQHHQGDAFFIGAIPEEKIVLAEEMLGNRLPQSYRSFIAKFGAGDVLAIEILGILKDPRTDDDGEFNAVAYTLSLRKDHRLPDNFVIVGLTGYGPYYALVCSKSDPTFEGEVVLWDIGNQFETVAPSFAHYLVHRLQNKLA